MKKKVAPPNDKQTTTGANATSNGRIEKDMDDLAHSRDEETEQNEEDLDDKVHQVNKSKLRQIDQQDNLEDPDDLVHDYPQEDDK